MPAADPTHVDVVAIGAGQAGVPLILSLARQGQSAVLIEKAKLGGSCVNFGCTPTKAALASARRAADVRDAAALGVHSGEVRVDFAEVMTRARGFAEESRGHLDALFGEDGPARLIRGHARLWGREGDRLRVIVDDGPELLARAVVIDTGAQSYIPPIPGIDAVPIITAETWLDLIESPRHLVMLGSGAIGLEMAQFYRRTGSAVTLIETAERIMPHEDAEVADAIHSTLEAEGVEVVTGAQVLSVGAHGSGVRLQLDGRTIDASHLFVATGRVPAVAELGLDSVGLVLGKGSVIPVGGDLATAVPGLYAAGDVRGGLQFTHTAWDDHRILLSVLGKGEPHSLRRVVPYATFTDPEIGRVGINQLDAEQQGVAFRSFCYPLSSIKKASLDGRPAGFIKLLSDPARDRLLGAAIVGETASELIHLFALLMHLDGPLSAIAGGVYAHPTLGEGVQSAVSAMLAEA